VLRLAEHGESIQVTDRGRPIALITPLQAASPLEQLRAAGEVSVPVGSIGNLPKPIVPPARSVSPSAVLARLRTHER
jgi:antitoxin (DNA-binding transcriptional repressor) of toxin-antitoxin stability system